MAAITKRQAELAEYRDYVRSLMRQRELPTRQVTVMHRDLFASASIPWNDGASMEAVLSGLHMGELISLAKQLRTEEDDDGDDD